MASIAATRYPLVYNWWKEETMSKSNGQHGMGGLRACLEAGQPPGANGLYEHLSEVEEHLPVAGLAHVAPFVRAYGALTARVAHALEADKFHDPETTERLAVDFGGWFLSALRAHTENKDDVVPPAWRRLFDLKADKHTPPGLLFALGMNAHIRNDLPQSTHRVGATPAYERDFFHVDAVIGDLAPRLTPSYVPELPLFRDGMTFTANNVIGVIRKIAWSDFLSLRAADELGPQEHNDVVRRIEQRADMTARALLLTKWVGTAATRASSTVGLDVQPFPPVWTFASGPE